MRIETSSKKTTSHLDLRDLEAGVMYWYECPECDSRLVYIPALNDGSRKGTLLNVDGVEVRPHEFKLGESPRFHQVHKSFRITFIQD